MTLNYTNDEAKAMRETDSFDPRNVTDRFKGMPTQTIKSILQSESSELVVCVSSLIRDMNASSVIRSANGFNVKKVIIAGQKKYDRRGAVGAQNYTIVEHATDIFNVISTYRHNGYVTLAAEYDESRVQYNIRDYVWEEKTLLILGEEGRGLESNILDAVDDICYIPMLGSVRSYNLASAATVMMYDYHVKMTSKS